MVGAPARRFPRGRGKQRRVARTRWRGGGSFRDRPRFKRRCFGRVRRPAQGAKLLSGRPAGTGKNRPRPTSGSPPRRAEARGFRVKLAQEQDSRGRRDELLAQAPGGKLPGCRFERSGVPSGQPSAVRIYFAARPGPPGAGPWCRAPMRVSRTDFFLPTRSPWALPRNRKTASFPPRRTGLPRPRETAPVPPARLALAESATPIGLGPTSLAAGRLRALGPDRARRPRARAGRAGGGCPIGNPRPYLTPALARS